jgi:hypothetical protein
MQDSKKMQKRTFLLITSLLFSVSCDGQRESLYQSVNSKEKWAENGRLMRKYDLNQTIPKYVIFRNEMYLNIQNVRSRMFYTEVDQPNWDQNLVTAMKSSDAVFSSHLPRSADPSGGIGWLTTN